MFQEVEEKFKHDLKWLKVDFATILQRDKVDALFAQLVDKGEIILSPKCLNEEKHSIPMFGAANLRGKGIEVLCDSLKDGLKDSLHPLGRTPSTVRFTKQQSVWGRIIYAQKALYTVEKLKKALEKLSEDKNTTRHKEKLNNEAAKRGPKDANEVLIHTGVKTSLDLAFSLMRQTWAQLAWQKQLHQIMTTSMGSG